ncbi:SymE family type I addiction module toxin [Pseudocitrobacter corydidari]
MKGAIALFSNGNLPAIDPSATDISAEPGTGMPTFYSRSPSLRLNSSWLGEAGFSTDTPVIVSVEQGRLVIQAVKD